MRETNRIYKEDCIKFLQSLNDQSVDLVFYDPPYNAKKNYDTYKDDIPQNEYVDWMRKVIVESNRVSMRGICIYVSGDLSFLFSSLLHEHGNINHIVIHKRAAGICKKNLARQFHSIITNSNPVKRTRNLWDDIRLPGEGYFFKEKRYDNPGLTSRKLVEKVLDCFTLEGETIADPFMGVGTTAVACKTMNRNYIGSELNPKYIKIAKERLTNCVGR